MFYNSPESTVLYSVLGTCATFSATAPLMRTKKGRARRGGARRGGARHGGAKARNNGAVAVVRK